jgi:CHASE2 domain-containing sensor protein
LTYPQHSPVSEVVPKSEDGRGAGRRFVLLCGVAPALLTVALALGGPGFLTQLDRRVYDGMLRATPAARPDSRVAIVDIDERSLAAIGQWPWRRDVMAQLITRLRDMGTAAVALDVIFAEPDRFDGTRADARPTDSGDTQLADAIRRGRVALGYAFTFDNAAIPAPGCVAHPVTIATLQPRGSNAGLPAFRAKGAICNLPDLTQAAATSGFLNAAPDSDGMLRRVPLLIEYEGRAYPGFAFAAMLAATGARPIALQTINVNAVSLSLDTGSIPLDGRSNILLRYRGGSRSLPYVSASDVLSGHVTGVDLKDKIVFVGATALGTRDTVTTPFDTQVAGVEVQATVADNLLHRDFISRVPDALTVEMAAVLGFGIAMTLLVARFGLAWGCIGAAIALVGLWRGAIWILSARNHYLSPLFPAVGLVASLGSATIARLAYERRRADRSVGEKDAANRMMVQSLLSLTEIRDAETGNHSRRTQQYSRLLAQQLAMHPRFREYLTPERIDLLSALAPLHDIGKVGVPDQLLNKPASLTTEEFREMKKHPVYGLSVITTAQRRARAGEDPILAMAKDIVYTHHERWDGQGYPQGLKGEQIPIPGRLMAIVDVYDALTTNRCYRESLPHDRAVELIADGQGTHFDPAVVDAFMQSASLLRTVAHDLSDAAVHAAAGYHALS